MVYIFYRHLAGFYGTCIGKNTINKEYGPGIVTSMCFSASLIICKSTWRIIPFSKWSITIVSKSPKWGCFPSKWPEWLINGD